MASGIPTVPAQPYDGVELTSANYTDAKAAWQRYARTFRGTLPRPFAWEMRNVATNAWHGGSVAAATKRAEVFGSGFMSAHFPDSAPQSTTSALVDGYAHMPAYVAAARLPYIVRLGVGVTCLTAGLSDGTTQHHPCYAATGRHLGSDAGADPCAAGVANPIADEKYRFDVAGTPEDPPALVGSAWAFPLFDDTVDLFARMDAWKMSAHPFYGMAIVNALRTTYGVPHWPTGYTADFEDIPNQWDVDTTIRGKYSNDSRFGFASTGRESAHRRFLRLKAAAIEARLAAIDALGLPTLNRDESIVYDVSPLAMKHAAWTEPHVLGRDGRRRANLTFYPFLGTGTSYRDFAETLHAVGNGVAAAAVNDTHTLMGWVCSTAQFPTGAGSVYPDVAGTANADEGVASIAQAIAAARLLYFFGAEQLAVYNSSGASADYWTTLIAFEEMSRHAPLVRTGKNFIPPAVLRKRHKRYDGAVTWNPTVWYGRDSAGAAIDDTVFIACRTWRGGEAFFGLTANATGRATATTTKTVIAPSGRAVEVTCTPWGTLAYV